MKTFFAIIGWTVFTLFIGSTIGAWDMRVCVGAVGTCNPLNHSAVAANQRGASHE